MQSPHQSLSPGHRGPWRRSLDGARDTEILVGGAEAGVLPPGPGQPPRGAIAAFRLRLWAEHLGAVDPAQPHARLQMIVRSSGGQDAFFC